MSLQFPKFPASARTTFLEWIHLLAELIFILGTSVAVLKWLRGRNKRILGKIRALAAGIIGMAYFVWFVLATSAWGIVTVNAVEQPTFISSMLVTHVVATVGYFLVVVFGPALPSGLAIKRLVPDQWPGGKKDGKRPPGRSRRQSQRTRRKSRQENPTYIQITGPDGTIPLISWSFF